MIFSREQVRGQFEKCRRDNLNAIWATETLYVEGNSGERFRDILEHNLRPLYESAKLQGYELWKFGGTGVTVDVYDVASNRDAEKLFKVAETK